MDNTQPNHTPQQSGTPGRAEVSGYVAVEQQSGGISAGVNTPHNQYIGPVTQVYGGGEAPAPLPVSLRGRLSRSVPTPSPIFTGRAAELRLLHDALRAENVALTPVPHALQGLGGVGKTQTACRYVHEHRAAFEGVFWVIGDTPQRLQAELAALAPELAPPVPVSYEQEARFRAVLHWFATHPNWLLVVDNAEQLPALKPLLPQHPTGRVLLTTREPVPPRFGRCIAIEHLDDATGATLLLRAAGMLASDATLDAVDAETCAGAKQVSADLGGLPLALDQAGAYMQPEALAPAAYLERYGERGQALHRRYPETDHQRVEVTVALTLERVQQTPDVGDAATQLAYLCAFLAPDAIPDEVFLTRPDVLPAALAPFAHNSIDFREVWEAACRGALLRRETNPPGLSMHRLAQEVLRNRLNEDERKATSERVMQAVNVAFPYPEFPTWGLCARLLPHALACIQHIQEHALHMSYAARLLNNTGRYLQHRAAYKEAEPLRVQALAIVTQVHGEEHANVATAFNNLGMLYREMGRYEQAAECQEQAVAIDRSVLGEDDAGYATDLDNLAGVYYLQHRYEEAIALNERALAVTRRALGSQHPHVAIRLNNLANVYTSTSRYEEAELLLLEAQGIDRQTIGQDHPDYAARLLSLAFLYIQSSRASEAEPLLHEALSICTRVHGSQHPDVATCHFWQGKMHYKQGNRTAALAAFRQAWEIQERALGPQHPDTVAAREWLDDVQREMEPSSGLRPPSPFQGEG